MEHVDLPKFPTRHGFMSETIQRKYILAAIANGVLPEDAHRMPEILSMTAPSDPAKPIQFWQLYSVMGQDPIVQIIQEFYQRVFADEEWFSSVFARVGAINHHINTQASMWIDVMGSGPYYHGAEYRLNFHHTHNAMALMNDKGAARWVALMVKTLDGTTALHGQDPRLRISINTFLAYFMMKYADDFAFADSHVFGETNAAYRRKINFMKMTQAAIEALSEAELSAALADRGVDLAEYKDKQAMINKALMM